MWHKFAKKFLYDDDDVQESTVKAGKKEEKKLKYGHVRNGWDKLKTTCYSSFMNACVCNFCSLHKIPCEMWIKRNEICACAEMAMKKCHLAYQIPYCFRFCVTRSWFMTKLKVSRSINAPPLPPPKLIISFVLRLPYK